VRACVRVRACACARTYISACVRVRARTYIYVRARVHACPTLAMAARLKQLLDTVQKLDTTNVQNNAQMRDHTD